MSQPGQTKGLDEIFCPSCAQIIKRDAAICFHCGVPLAVVPAATIARRPRSKAVAVILAVFLGYWAWLYTYRRDAWKFWLNLALTIVTLLVWAVVAWIWAIIDTAARPASFYENYGRPAAFAGDAGQSSPFALAGVDPAAGPLPGAPPEDAESMRAYRRDLLLRKLGAANVQALKHGSMPRRAMRKAIVPLFVCVLLAAAMAVFYVEVGWGYLRGEYRYALFGGVAIVVLAVAFFLARLIAVKRAAAKRRRLKRQADEVAALVEKEFPDLAEAFGGKEGLRDFLPPKARPGF